MTRNDIWPCFFILNTLHILCALFEPKINFSFKNTLNKDHRHVENQSKVQIEGVCPKLLNSLKKSMSKAPQYVEKKAMLKVLSTSKKKYIKSFSLVFEKKRRKKEKWKKRKKWKKKKERGRREKWQQLIMEDLCQHPILSG